MATKIKTNPPMKTISEFVSRNSWIYVVLAFLVLLMMAFGLDKKVPRPAILNRLTARARFKACKLSAYGGASAMGLANTLSALRPALSGFRRGAARRFRREGRGVHARVRPRHGAAAVARATSISPHPGEADAARDEPPALRAGLRHRAGARAAAARHDSHGVLRWGDQNTGGGTAVLLSLAESQTGTPPANSRSAWLWRLDHFQDPCLKVLAERPQFHQPVLRVEGNEGSTRALAAWSAGMTVQADLVIRRMISARALKSTREGACAPLVLLDQESQSVALLVVGTQGTEQARAHRVHLRFLDPVFQLQIRQPRPRGLHQPLVMLHLRLLKNHQPYRLFRLLPQMALAFWLGSAVSVMAVR